MIDISEHPEVIDAINEILEQNKIAEVKIEKVRKGNRLIDVLTVVKVKRYVVKQTI